MTYADLPEQGWVCWPVGKGDSTTVVADSDNVVQFDLRDMKAAEQDDAVVAAVTDRLAETLPRRESRPYLWGLLVGHHDEDHCAGAKRFFEEVLVGELWVTSRMWHELAEGLDLAEHAEALRVEAERRIAATLAAQRRGGRPVLGDRIRIVGEHPDEQDHPYDGLAAEWRVRPGESVVVGDPAGEHAEITVHGPVADDCSQPGIEGRNPSSMLLHVQVSDGAGTEAALLLVGDVDHSVLERLFSDAEAAGTLAALGWDTTLAAHHCSRHAVFGLDATGVEERKQAVLDAFAATARPGARMIASSREFRACDASGDDPPHRAARDAYEEFVVAEDLLCTAEYPTVEDPRPIVFALRPGVGLELVDPEEVFAAATSSESKTIDLASGSPRRALLAALGATSSVAPDRRTLPAATRNTGTEAVGRAVTSARGHARVANPGLGFG